MNMTEGKKKKTLWNFIDNLEGDKVVWMIVLLLILFSIVAIFSSTTQMTTSTGMTRMEIVGEQMMLALIGLLVIIGCYIIPKIGIFRILSQFGYAASMILLLILVFRLDLGPVKALRINDAWRIVSVFGLQVHVFEFVKVVMVMYLAWATTTLRKDDFTIVNNLSQIHPFWKKTIVKKIVYIYIPLFSTCLCMMVGSLSSTIFIGGILAITLLVGGIKFKELLLAGAVAVAMLTASIGFNACFPAGHKPFPHLEHALSRVGDDKDIDTNLKIMEESPEKSPEFYAARDKIYQPMSAKIALKEGGLFGKGPGKSTQSSVVSIMYEDFMFCFIVEEYGLVGGIILIILYISLLARASIIVRNCDNPFAKTAVGGLAILITGQAMMHIAVNSSIVPLTGQTLPMISHGASSFLMFSLAFGIILSISKMAKRKIDKETKDAEPLVNREVAVRDEVRSGMDDLDLMESGYPVHENDIPDYEIDDHNNE